MLRANLLIQRLIKNANLDSKKMAFMNKLTTQLDDFFDFVSHITLYMLQLCGLF